VKFGHLLLKFCQKADEVRQCIKRDVGRSLFILCCCSVSPCDFMDVEHFQTLKSKLGG
jgi:hypothetical protein